MKKKIISALFIMVVALFIGVVSLPSAVKAAGSKISVSDIDYDDLTMKVYTNGNAIVYFSTDARKTWNELEGNVLTDGGKSYKLMDISWASTGADVTLYLKGDVNSEVLDVVFPKQSSNFKVKYQKASGEFTFTGNDDFAQFMWRKSTDYNWHIVDFDEKSASYKAFMTEMDSLRFKGAKVVFKTGQVMGKNESDMGERPGKDVVVAIPKRANAPSIKVNVTKMTLNTKNTMEYFDEATSKWVACEKNMTIADIAPGTLIAGGAKKMTLKIRVAETETKPYSQTAMIVIPGQGAAPSVGTDVKCGFENGKLALTFLTASDTHQLEYCVIKPGTEFVEANAKWKTIKKNKVISLTQKSAPDGTKVYFRVKGVAANASKGIDLVLPSTYCNYDVKWPAVSSTPTPTPAK